MKKLAALLLVVAALLFVFAAPVQAVKPDENLAAAEKVVWHLSADVMPSPPYGYYDIPGSDTASKLIVNQPNGNTEVTITGVMNGLNHYTVYTVYLSKPWEPGDTWWNGLFTDTVQPFTFTTDAYGAGSWHINLVDSDFQNEPGTYALSVWINVYAVDATLLISDNFQVVVD